MSVREQQPVGYEGEDKWVRMLREWGANLLDIGSVLSCVLMLFLFLVGFWLIMGAIWWNRDALLNHALSSPTDDSSAMSAIARSQASHDPRALTIGVLHGLEFFFLAPLPALVFLSLARFFRDFQTSHDAARPGHESGTTHQLHRVKALVVSLMIASIATDLLGRALQGISLEAAVPELLVMVLLGTYWLFLERLAAQKR